MYTVMMDSDKNLITTVKTILYQREKLVDKIQFLLPTEYEEVDLTQCSAYLKYVDQANVIHTEPLTPDEELYKDMIRYELPIDSNLTQFAGTITYSITCLSAEYSEVLHTAEGVITIEPVPDYYAFVNDKSLEVIDRKLLAAQAIADEYKKTKADNLIVDDNKISLTAEGEKIGDEFDIVTPRINDGKYDGDYNGVLELDDIDSEDEDGKNKHHHHREHKNHFVEL